MTFHHPPSIMHTIRCFLVAIVLISLEMPCAALWSFNWPEDMPLKPVHVAPGVWDFDSGTASGGWGIIDEQGHYQISPLFEKVAIFFNGYAPVMKNGRWGFIDTQARMIVPCQLDNIWEKPPTTMFRVRFSAGAKGEPVESADEVSEDWSGGFDPGVFPACKDDKWGVIASSGTWLVEPCLDRIHPVSETSALVEKQGKFGFIARNGIMVVEPVFDGAGRFADGLAPCSEKGRWGFIDASGTFVIEPQYAYAFPFVHGSAIVQEGKKIGVLGTDGKWKLPPIYESIVSGYGEDLFRTESDFHYGLYSPLDGELASTTYDFMWAEPHQLVTVSHDSLKGLLSKQGKILLACDYDEIEVDETELVRMRRNDRWGFFDLAKQRLIEPRYEKIRPFSEDLAAVSSNGLWGFVDRNGAPVIPVQYAWAGDFFKSQAPVMTASACFVIDREGRMIREPVFDMKPYRKPLPDGSIAIRLHRLHGFFDPRTGTFPVPPNLDDARWFEETGVILAKEAGFWRIRVPGGKERCSLAFKDVGTISENRCWVKALDGRYGFIDQAGNIVVPPAYDEAYGFHRDRAAVRKGRMWGFINSRGEELIPLEFDSVTSFYENDEDAIEAVQKGVKGLLDRMGNFHTLEAPLSAGSIRKEFPHPEDPRQPSKRAP